MTDISVGLYSPLSKLSSAVFHEKGCQFNSAVSKVNSILFKDWLKYWIHNQEENMKNYIILQTHLSSKIHDLHSIKNT